MFHVKPDPIDRRILEHLSAVGIDLSAEQEGKIERYCHLIRAWSARTNLISKADVEELVSRHLVPSLYMASICHGEENRKIADIGAGSGFMGFMIKILYPNKEIILIDSSRKKYLFLIEVCELLNMDCRVIHDRADKISPGLVEPLDLAVCRAVASMKELWQWARPLLREKGALCALKGDDSVQEIKDLEQQKLKVTIIKPDKVWIKLSAALESKLIIRVEE